MLKSLATKAIAQLSLIIGDSASKYWSHAYLWAKQVMNRRKYKRANSDFYEDSPYKQVKDIDPNFHALKPFGAVCTVHDHYADAHAVTGRKGVILGLSDLHHEKVDKILMLDTNRIIHSIDVTLSGGRVCYHDKDSKPVVTSEMADEFYHKVQISNLYLPQDSTTDELPTEMSDPSTVAELEGSYDAEPEGSMDSEIEGSTLPDPSGSTISPSTMPLASKVVTPVTQVLKHQFSQLLKSSSPATKVLPLSAKQLKSRKHHVLSSDALSLSKCKTPYLVLRAKACDGLTVEQCIKMKYKHADGSIKRIKMGDLAYDIKSGRIKITHPVLLPHPAPTAEGTTSINAAHSYHEAFNDRSWLQDLPHQTKRKPMYDEQGVLLDAMFDRKAQLFLMYASDAAPLNDDPQHNVAVEWDDGNTTIYDFVRDRSPHAFAVDSVGPLDKPPRSLHEVHRLPENARNMYLRALEKEYNGLWQHGTFRLIKRSDVPQGSKVFPTTTVFKMKFHQDGSMDVAKARVCLRGDLMLPGRDFGDVRSPTTQNESVKLMLADCPISGKIACTFDIKQAFRYGLTDPTRPLFCEQFPGTEKMVDEMTGEELVQQCINCLYGHPAAPKAFHAEMHKAFTDYEFEGTCFLQS